MTAEPTSLASWTRALRKQLDALGLDSARLCQEAGLDPALMEHPNARYPLSATTSRSSPSTTPRGAYNHDSVGCAGGSSSPPGAGAPTTQRGTHPG